MHEIDKIFFLKSLEWEIRRCWFLHESKLFFADVKNASYVVGTARAVSKSLLVKDGVVHDDTVAVVNPCRNGLSEWLAKLYCLLLKEWKLWGIEQGIVKFTLHLDAWSEKEEVCWAFMPYLDVVNHL